MVGRNLLENEEAGKYDILCPSSVELNLMNYNDVRNYLKKKNPDMIVHCAGKVGGIQANIEDMYGFFTNNIVMGINIVKAAKEHGVRQLLNLSSSCTYPKNYRNPLKEEYALMGELEPTNEGYALAKLSIQRMCEYISKEYTDFQYKTFIPCNLYGRWDKFDEKHSHMIASVIKKIHNAIKTGADTIGVWGDGTARREFMYAADLASCIIQALQDFNTIPSTMNIGTGFDFTINEYYEMIKNVLGYKGTFIYDISKPTGMKQKLLDITRQTQWRWKPGTSLEEGIRRTYQFFMEYYNEKI
jgi:GDP-L-fucose synthase